MGKRKTLGARARGFAFSTARVGKKVLWTAPIGTIVSREFFNELIKSLVVFVASWGIFYLDTPEAVHWLGRYGWVTPLLYLAFTFIKKYFSELAE